jgi:hypothetical protein
LIVEKMRCTDIRPLQLEFDIVKGQGIVIQSSRYSANSLR